MAGAGSAVAGCLNDMFDWLCCSECHKKLQKTPRHLFVWVHSLIQLLPRAALYHACVHRGG